MKAKDIYHLVEHQNMDFQEAVDLLNKKEKDPMLTLDDFEIQRIQTIEYKNKIIYIMKRTNKVTGIITYIARINIVEQGNTIKEAIEKAKNIIEKYDNYKNGWR